jgi:hypothetical protein
MHEVRKMESSSTYGPGHFVAAMKGARLLAYTPGDKLGASESHTAHPSAAFGRFADLTARLVRVPKPELDEKRAQDS